MGSLRCKFVARTVAIAIMTATAALSQAADARSWRSGGYYAGNGRWVSGGHWYGRPNWRVTRWAGSYWRAGPWWAGNWGWGAPAWGVATGLAVAAPYYAAPYYAGPYYRCNPYYYGAGACGSPVIYYSNDYPILYVW